LVTYPKKQERCNVFVAAQEFRVSDKVGAVLVAAGKGERMGGVDKVFAPVAGKPLLAWVIEAFEKCSVVQDIVVVLHETSLERGKALVTEGNYSKVVEVCPGGLRRQDSVARGLEKLRGCDWVVIHDGARPCVNPNLIEQGLREAKGTGAAIAAVPAKDTVKRVGPGLVIEETPNRESLWMAQTPQVFRWDIVSQAYREASFAVTDDAALVEGLGYEVKVYMGSYDNIKVTTPKDLALVELLMAQGDS
jgi:2-C-methyl-D-erythritol 4-phosphate cytidylyltransferase